MLKKILRETAFKIPGIRPLWTRWINGKLSRHQFVGWGMTTDTMPPWKGNTNSLGKDFLAAHDAVLAAAEKGEFKLSQFGSANARTLLEGLMWRHFVVFWTARYSMLSTGKVLVECGVCDGLTAFFALKATNNSRKAWLYDAWEGMKSEHLLDTEMSYVDAYDYLDMEQTKKNLRGLDTKFIKGFIPDSFKANVPNEGVAWLHVDLNAAIPTMASLEEIFPKMPAGGVVLFDDYAGKGFEDTRKQVDTFFSDKPGQLLHMPTGQAIFFKAGQK